MRPGGGNHVKVQKGNEKAFVDADVLLHKQEPNSSQTSAHDVTAAAPKSSVESLQSLGSTEGESGNQHSEGAPLY